MFVTNMLISITIYDALSLKDKRMVVKSIIERIRSRFNVSVCEAADNDKWQVSDLGFSFVSNESKYNEKTIEKIINFIDNDDRVEITNIDKEMYSYEKSIK